MRRREVQKEGTNLQISPISFLTMKFGGGLQRRLPTMAGHKLDIWLFYLKISTLHWFCLLPPSWHNQEVWSRIVVQPASRSAALLSVRQSRGRSGCCQVERPLATRKESWPSYSQQQMGENRIQRAFNFGRQTGKPSNNGLLTRGKGERMNGKRLNSS